MAVTELGYSQMLEILMHIAEEYCQGRLVLTLEGGYDLVALRESVRTILNLLSSYNCDKELGPFQPALDHLNSTFRARLRDVIATQTRYWPNLSTL